MRIAEILPGDDHILYVLADDGEAGSFDLNPYLNSEAFAPLRNRDEFERVRNGGYFVEWECGADLSADTIAARWKVLSTEQANAIFHATAVNH